MVQMMVCVDDLLELSGDAMHYVMIEKRPVESLRMKWEDAKRTKLEYSITNVDPQCWSQYKARMPVDRIQPYLITNMSSNARRALTLLSLSHHRSYFGLSGYIFNVHKRLSI